MKKKGGKKIEREVGRAAGVRTDTGADVMQNQAIGKANEAEITKPS